MQQPVIPRVRAPSDLTQTSIAIVIGNQVYGVPAIELGDAFGFQPLNNNLTEISALTTTAYGRSLLESASAAALFASIKQAATDTATGVVELATAAEAQTGTDTTRAITAAGLRAATREKLAANRTYYVRTDGSDSNTGLANTSGGAFLTIQKAINVIAGTLDLAGFTVTVQVADGTYTGSNTLKEVVGYSAPGCLVIQGNSGTPANVVISTTSAHCYLANNINSCWDIKDQKVQTTTAGTCLYAINSSIRWGNLDFGAAAQAHIIAQDGAFAACLSSYTISGGTGLHWSADAGGIIRCQAVTVTLTGTPAFSNQFANSRSSAQIICNANTFSGAATGTRYSAANGGLINTSGGGATYLPGNAAGAGTNFGVSPWGLYV